MRPRLFRRVRSCGTTDPAVLAALVASALLTACESPGVVEAVPPALAVNGYVTVSVNPAAGVVTLHDPEGLSLSASPIVYGRYEVSWPVEAGTRVCDGYRIFIRVPHDRTERTKSVMLDDSTGPCTMPANQRLWHRVDVDFPLQPGGGK